MKVDPLDPDSYLESSQSLGSETIAFKRTSVFLLRERYMSFLLHLNEDFDDDLLLDSLGVLDCL